MCLRASTPLEVMDAVCCGSIVTRKIDVEQAKFVDESKPQATQTRLQATAIKRIVDLGKKATTSYACERASEHQFRRGRHRIVWNLIIHTPITPFVEEKHHKPSLCVEECPKSRELNLCSGHVQSFKSVDDHLHGRRCDSGD